jgi:cyclopropane fatty-acyl-phospholipid synthase-like methyltransferase
MGRSVTYDRRVFDVPDEQAAKRIILTPEFGEGTDQRWERETPYLVDLIGQQLSPKRDALVIDYGCGIGRLAKALIERFGVRVLGVDLSERMRALAPDYVKSQMFSVVSPHMLQSMADGGLRADHAFSVWVLQHCLSPALDISLLRHAIAEDGRLFVANLKGRAVPTAEGVWANDGLDVFALLAERFAVAAKGELDEAFVPPQTREITFWATLGR